MHNSKLVQNAQMWDKKTKNYPKFVYYSHKHF